MKFQNEILEIRIVSLKTFFWVLMFVSFSGFSKTNKTPVLVKAIDTKAYYSLHENKHKTSFHLNTEKQNNNNNFRIICDNDSTHFSFYTNTDSVFLIIKPQDTVYLKIVSEVNTLIATISVIGYDKTENYSSAYINENTNAIVVDIPEVSELVKIILLLNQDELEKGIKGKNSMYKEIYASDYYKEILDYFYKFRNEKIVKELAVFSEDPSYSNRSNSYMDLKRFSTLYKFNAENKIVKTKYYNLEAGNDYDIFEDFIPQITNFAIKTNFREFYKSHIKNYRESKDNYMNLVPVNSIWNFTEKHFKNKIQFLKIINSPLESFFYVSSTNYNKNLPFNQYVFYTTTPIWRIEIDKNAINQNYIRNSYVFFKAQLTQYLDDYFKDDTLLLDNLFKKKNNWIYQNKANVNHSGKFIFYTYIINALFNQYYEEDLKLKYKDEEGLNLEALFNNYYGNYLFDEMYGEHVFGKNKLDLLYSDLLNLLKLDKFNIYFSSVYQKHKPEQFDLVLEEMQEWCKKQK